MTEYSGILIIANQTLIPIMATIALAIRGKYR